MLLLFVFRIGYKNKTIILLMVENVIVERGIIMYLLYKVKMGWGEGGGVVLQLYIMFAAS